MLKRGKCWEDERVFLNKRWNVRYAQGTTGISTLLVLPSNDWFKWRDVTSSVSLSEIENALLSHWWRLGRGKSCLGDMSQFFWSLEHSKITLFGWWPLQEGWPVPQGAAPSVTRSPGRGRSSDSTSTRPLQLSALAEGSSWNSQSS